MIEVNVNVKVSLSEDTVSLLASIFGNIQTSNAKTPTIAIAEPKKEKPKLVREEKPAPTAGTSVDLEMIRVKVVAHNRDEAKKAKVVKLYQEYGIEKVNGLKKEQYAEFYEKLSAIG